MHIFCRYRVSAFFVLTMALVLLYTGVAQAAPIHIKNNGYNHLEGVVTFCPDVEVETIDDLFIDPFLYTYSVKSETPSLDLNLPKDLSRSVLTNFRQRCKKKGFANKNFICNYTDSDSPRRQLNRDSILNAPDLQDFVIEESTTEQDQFHTNFMNYLRADSYQPCKIDARGRYISGGIKKEIEGYALIEVVEGFGHGIENNLPLDSNNPSTYTISKDIGSYSYSFMEKGSENAEQYSVPAYSDVAESQINNLATLTKLMIGQDRNSLGRFLPHSRYYVDKVLSGSIQIAKFHFDKNFKKPKNSTLSSIDFRYDHRSTCEYFHHIMGLCNFDGHGVTTTSILSFSPHLVTSESRLDEIGFGNGYNQERYFGGGFMSYSYVDVSDLDAKNTSDGKVKIEFAGSAGAGAGNTIDDGSKVFVELTLSKRSVDQPNYYAALAFPEENLREGSINFKSATQDELNTILMNRYIPRAELKNTDGFGYCSQNPIFEWELPDLTNPHLALSTANGFRVYRDKVLIAELSSTTSEFEDTDFYDDQKIRPGSVVEYTFTALNADREETLKQRRSTMSVVNPPVRVYKPIQQTLNEELCNENSN